MFCPVKKSALKKTLFSIVVTMLLLLNSLSLTGGHLKIHHHKDGKMELVVFYHEISSDFCKDSHQCETQHILEDKDCHESPLCCNDGSSEHHLVSYIPCISTRNSLSADLSFDHSQVFLALCRLLKEKVQPEPANPKPRVQKQTEFHKTVVFLI